MNEDSAIEYLGELETNALMDVLNEWQTKKNIPDSKQSWKVISASKLIREWQYNQRVGLTHDKVIAEFQGICIQNFTKLYINSVLFGHTPHDPFYFAELWIPEDWNESDFDLFLEDFEWFAVDDRDNWRISDYAIEKLWPIILKLLQEKDGNTKLFLIDQILNIVHQRSDLASWFVEGGNKTLYLLSND